MKSACLFFLLLAITLPAFTQRELTLVPDPLRGLNAVLGGVKNTVTRVTVVSESEKTATLSVEFTGFRDKKYLVKAFALNGLKKQIAEIEPVSIELPSTGNSVEITFRFQQKEKAYAQQYLETAFIGIMFMDAASAMASVSGAFSDINIGGATFTYQYPKQWRVTGSQNMTVQIKLTPVGGAAALKP